MERWGDAILFYSFPISLDRSVDWNRVRSRGILFSPLAGSTRGQKICGRHWKQMSVRNNAPPQGQMGMEAGMEQIRRQQVHPHASATHLRNRKLYGDVVQIESLWPHRNHHHCSPLVLSHWFDTLELPLRLTVAFPIAIALRAAGSGEMTRAVPGSSFGRTSFISLPRYYSTMGKKIHCK
jgi:hypothetical protein